MKEAIMRDRAAWSEAAKTDPEHLTLDEFLAFRHPESSHATILALVDELFEKFGMFRKMTKLFIHANLLFSFLKIEMGMKS